MRLCVYIILLLLVAKSCPTLCDPMDYSVLGSSVMGLSSMNTGVGCHFLLQGIFPTQRSNPHLLHVLNGHMDSLPLSHQERYVSEEIHTYFISATKISK